ncbi:hypothetical protein AOLI_G00169740 [Acnodon oligacanthus]
MQKTYEYDSLARPTLKRTELIRFKCVMWLTPIVTQEAVFVRIQVEKKRAPPYSLRARFPTQPSGRRQQPPPKTYIHRTDPTCQKYKICQNALSYTITTGHGIVMGVAGPTLSAQWLGSGLRLCRSRCIAGGDVMDAARALRTGAPVASPALPAAGLIES